MVTAFPIGEKKDLSPLEPLHLRSSIARDPPRIDAFVCRQSRYFLDSCEIFLRWSLVFGWLRSYIIFVVWRMITQIMFHPFYQETG
jgi:hypothetical protein